MDEEVIIQHVHLQNDTITVLYHFYGSSLWMEQLSNEELFQITYSPISECVYRRCGYVLARRVWNKTGMTIQQSRFSLTK